MYIMHIGLIKNFVLVFFSILRCSVNLNVITYFVCILYVYTYVNYVFNENTITKLKIKLIEKRRLYIISLIKF